MLNDDQAVAAMMGALSGAPLCLWDPRGDRESAMQLTPREQEKLLIVVAADLARRRQARGLKPNSPEAVSLITAELQEGARDGRSVAALMQADRFCNVRK